MRVGLNIALLMVFMTVAPGPSAMAQGASAGQFDHLFDTAIEIDIEKEVDKKPPPFVAVPAAKMPGGNPGPHGELIAEVLRFDFQISGLFSRMPPRLFERFESNEGFTVDQIDFNKWHAVGTRYLVKSRYKTTVEGQLLVELGFFDVAKREEIELDWKASAVDARELRQTVHTFVNAVVEHMTGSKGIFGTRLALAQLKGGQKHILTMDMDGGNRAQVSSNKSINILPSWGNGGIYYTSYERDNPDLFFMKGEQTRVVSSVPGTNHGAAFCGDQVAVTLSMGSTNTDIYTIDPETGRIKARLTDHWGIDTSPTWSPDCSKIAFVSDRGGTPQIYVMEASGKGQARLTFSGRNNTTPEWSPKGDEIAFTGYTGTGSEVFVTNLRGFIRRVTHCNGNCEDPSWSPDGNFMAFIEQVGPNPPQVFITPLFRSRYKTRITRDGGIYATPSWRK